MQFLAQNTALTPLFRFASTFGIGSDRICDAAGLDLGAAISAGGMVPASSIIDAVEWTAEASAVANFGLLLSERLETRIIGLPALLAEQCQSISDYYDLLHQNLWRHSTGYSFSLDQDLLGGVGRLLILSQSQFAPRHFAEVAMAIHARAFQSFLGARWRPEKILLAHDRIGRLSDYRRAFGTEVIFGAGQNAVIFSPADLLWRAPSSELVARQRATDALTRLSATEQNPLETQASAIIRMLLPTQNADIEKVALALRTNVRTLQRNLKKSGTSFSELLAGTRIRLAREYLGRQELSATEVSSRLGFSEVSVLSRFLKRHTGAASRSLMTQRYP
jgi:AraC-like DNA-binding protein